MSTPVVFEIALWGPTKNHKIISISCIQLFEEHLKKKSLTNFQGVFPYSLLFLKQEKGGFTPFTRFVGESRQNITFKPLSLKPLTLYDDGDLDDWDEEDDFWGSSEPRKVWSM